VVVVRLLLSWRMKPAPALEHLAKRACTDEVTCRGQQQAHCMSETAPTICKRNASPLRQPLLTTDGVPHAATERR
jgi:hypothetical protein